MSVIKSGVYVYSSNLSNVFLSYLFWVVVAGLTGSEGPGLIGYLSSIIAFSTIVSTGTLLGMPMSIQRLVGKALAQNDNSLVSSLSISAFCLVLLLTSVAAITIVLLNEPIMSITGFSWDLLIVSLVIVFELVTFQILYSILLSIGRSRFILLGTLMQGVSKIVIIIFLLNGSYNVSALLMSFVFSYLIAITVMSAPLIKQLHGALRMRIHHGWKTLIHAGMSNWVPSMVSAIGGQLSVLSVFGYVGAAQAGEYYMASAIFSAVVGLPTAIFSAAFPVMSGMTDARKTLSWKITKYSLLISAPLAILTGVYANQILTMLNPALVNAVIPQRILLIGVVPAIINYGIYYLLYATGNYKSVLVAGLVENLSRVSLYFILVPSLGATGAAISYISGSFLSMIFMLLTQRKRFILSWKRVVAITSIPASSGLAIWFLAVDPIIGVPTILLACLFFYLRLDVARTDEIRGIVFSLMPSHLASRIFQRLERIILLVGKSQLFGDNDRI